MCEKLTTKFTTKNLLSPQTTMSLLSSCERNAVVWWIASSRCSFFSSQIWVLKHALCDSAAECRRWMTMRVNAKADRPAHSAGGQLAQKDEPTHIWLSSRETREIKLLVQHIIVLSVLNSHWRLSATRPSPVCGFLQRLTLGGGGGARFDPQLSGS